VQKHNSAGGRPKHVAEFIEGKQASSNFVGAMRQILSSPKTIPQHIGNGSQKRRGFAK